MILICRFCRDFLDFWTCITSCPYATLKTHGQLVLTITLLHI